MDASRIDIPALVLQNVQKRYGLEKALDGVNFLVQPGEVCGLLGPNGAGKSTLMRCITTLMRQDAGTIECLGVDTLMDPQGARETLGYVAQLVALDKVLTGREHLELHGALHHIPRRDMRGRIDAVLELVGLLEVAERRVSTYSGGMARRLDLATALLHRPRLLILDEPTVGLDIHTRSAIWRFIRHLSETGTAVLVASHHIEEIEYLSDRIVILDHGKVRAQGTAEELKAAFGDTLVNVKTAPYATREDLEALGAALAKDPHVAKVLVDESDGGRLAIALKEKLVDVAQLRKSMAQTLDAGEEVFTLFSVQRPSLADVFLAATGRTLRDVAWTAVDAPPAKRRRS